MEGRGKLLSRLVRRYCVFVVLLLQSLPIYSQDTNASSGLYTGSGPGRSTIGSGGDYAFLASAAADINKYPLTGGNWEFLILNDLTEPNNVYIGQSHTNGNTITIRPAVNTSVTVSFTTTTAYNRADQIGHLVIGATSAYNFTGSQLAPTSNVIIDGSAQVAGQDRSLTFRNFYNSGSGSIINIFGNSENICIRNCSFEHNNNRIGNVGVGAITLTSVNTFAPNELLGSPDYTCITNCYIDSTTWGTGTGIVVNDSAGLNPLHKPNIGLEFSRNAIRCEGAAMEIRQISSASITSNTITISSQLANTFTGGKTGIRCIHDAGQQATTPVKAVVVGNVIKFLSEAPLGSNLVGIEIRGRYPESEFLVANNMISGLMPVPPEQQGPNRYGIYHTSDSGTTATIVHNSINFHSTATAGFTTSYNAAAVYNSGISLAIVRNNIFRVETPGAAIFSTPVTYNAIRSDNNIMYTTTSAVVARRGNNLYSTLESWQTVSGQDLASKSIDPMLATGSTFTGHWVGPLGAVNPDMHFTAFPGAEYAAPVFPTVYHDIDANPRHAPQVLVGAHEVAPPPAGIFHWNLY